MPYGVIDATTAKAAPVMVAGSPLTVATASPKALSLAMLTRRLGRMLGGRSDEDPELRQLINDAYYEVADEVEHDQLRTSLSLTLDAAQPFYLLPPQVESTLGAALALPSTISFDQGVPLRKIDLATWRGLEDTTGQTTQLEPDAFFKEGNVLVVWPPPWTARTLVVDVMISPLPLTADDHVPFIDSIWHKAILLKAKAQALDDTTDVQAALIAANAYTAYMRSRTNKKALEKEGRFAGISVPRDWNDLRSLGRQDDSWRLR